MKHERLTVAELVQSAADAGVPVDVHGVAGLVQHCEEQADLAKREGRDQDAIFHLKQALELLKTRKR